jgi:hypothetical protein
MQEKVQNEEQAEANTHLVSPPVDIHWSVAAAVSAVTSLGMLRIVCAVLWLIK